MPFFAFLIASAVGACGVAWAGRHHRWDQALVIALVAMGLAFASWWATVPLSGRSSQLFQPGILLFVAILIPGSIGGFLAGSTGRGCRLVGFFLTAVLWLPLAYLGLLAVCGLDPACNV